MVTLTSRGQINLVPNASFEQIDSCPNGGDDFFVSNWINPTQSTPDCFHICNNQINGNVGVPENFAGYQSPFDGDGYIGLYTYEDLSEYREYVLCELSQTLEANKTYSVSMYVSLSGYGNMATDRLGVVFSSTIPFQNDYGVLSVSTAPISFEGVILDTIEWQHLVWKYEAGGTEQYMLIGNFVDDSETTLALIDSSETGYFSYYFIDQVSVIEDDNTEINFPTVITPNMDGINDELIIDDLNYPYSFNIFNRWGVNVYSVSNHPSIRWDGSSKNIKLCEGIYFYVFSSKSINRSGYVQLFR